MLNPHDIISLGKAITMAAATVRCYSTVTANVGTLKHYAYIHGKTRRYDAISIPAFTGIFNLICREDIIRLDRVLTVQNAEK